MRRSSPSVATLAALLLAASASAQTTPAPTPTPAPAPDGAARPTVPGASKPVTGPDIVVVGRKTPDARQALTFARTASAPVDGQLARFHDDVCPAVVGFSPDTAGIIVDRMREIAADAGATLARPGCRPNILLITTPDGGALLRQFERRGTFLIADLAPHDLHALIAAKPPVRSWTTTAVENEYGQVAYAPIGPYTPPRMTVYSASHIDPPTQQAIQVAVVMVDGSALVGKTTTQIADYAAMRTLARTRSLSGDGPIDSILSLFDPNAAPPAQASPADLAYLRTLYKMAGTHFAAQQVEQIAHTVKKASRAAP